MVIATSAVDLDTDRAIQEIIRGPQFKDVTMLTIAYVASFRLILPFSPYSFIRFDPLAYVVID